MSLATQTRRALCSTMSRVCALECKRGEAEVDESSGEEDRKNVERKIFVFGKYDIRVH